MEGKKATGQKKMRNEFCAHGYKQSKLLYTGQERDSLTNYDYMHFRYYSSSIGRFLKPDNIIGNLYNPQSWNLYSYVHNNPVNFNDPSGHYCKAAMTSQILFGPGGALGLSPAYGGMWEDPQGKGTMAPFAEAGSVSGYWQPVYGQAAYTSGGEAVWDTELGAWVGSEMTITSQVVGWQFVSEMSGGGSDGYLDFNLGVGLPTAFGFTGGVIFGEKGLYPYIGGGVVTPGLSVSLTYSKCKVSEGLYYGIQGELGIAGQTGVSATKSEDFWEKGVGTFGGAVTVFYILPPINIMLPEPSPANLKFYSCR